MDHLRHHPVFQPLPHPDKISRLKYLEDARYFRQDSWQWDALHNGRCTTSQAAPALGLMEPKAAKLLGIPRSLQNGSSGAYCRLGEPALRTLKEMNEILCTGDGNDHIKEKSMNNHAGVWKLVRTRKFPFAAKYMPRTTRQELDSKKRDAKEFFSSISSPMMVRMKWGNSQEATAILTALNYFHNKEPGIVIKEVGMCGSGLGLNSTSTGNGLLVGASPDAVIEYPNGTLEALEVKNHCPFVPADWGLSKKKSNNLKKDRDKFRIRTFPSQSSVPPAYLPQLMMEMMCLGPQCKSAVLVRQTAMNGSIILRLHRDEEWIEEMLFWLRRFMDDYVNKNCPPPQNFFWDDDKDSERFKSFVQRTKDLADSVELVEHVSNGSIQRVLPEGNLTSSLFLD